MTKLKYILNNWKLGVHLVFKTRRFGVNNQWWSKFDSVLGVTKKQWLWDIVRIWPIVRNYKLMKFRAIHLGFITPEEAELLWPRYEYLWSKNVRVYD